MKDFNSWIFINILIPLLPIAFKRIVIYFSPHIELKAWYEIIQDGELYIYSITLSASTFILANLQSKNTNSLKDLLICILIINILLCSVTFASGNLFMLINQNDTVSNNKLKVYVIGSLFASIITIVCSYLIISLK